MILIMHQIIIVFNRVGSKLVKHQNVCSELQGAAVFHLGMRIEHIVRFINRVSWHGNAIYQDGIKVVRMQNIIFELFIWKRLLFDDSHIFKDPSVLFCKKNLMLTTYFGCNLNSQLNNFFAS